MAILTTDLDGLGLVGGQGQGLWMAIFTLTLTLTLALTLTLTLTASDWLGTCLYSTMRVKGTSGDG